MSINVEEFTSRKVGETFPNILVLHPNDTLPVVVRSLKEGDMQLVVEHNGLRKCVARVAPSAYNIDRLLRTVGTVEYVLGEGSSVTIDSVEKYLYCLV